MSDRPLPPVTGNGDNATVKLIDHLEAIRAGDLALQQERDRRYAEVALEREKALKIKEAADLAALQLAREIQTYKDEKANELREQISRERGMYVTQDQLKGQIDRIEAMLKPLSDFVQSQGAILNNRRLEITQLVQIVGLLVAIGLGLFGIFTR